MLIALGGMLSSCSTIDLRNAYALSKAGPMDGNPETGRLAVMWPADIEAAGILFSFTLEKDGDVIHAEQFMLDPDETAKPLIKKPKGKNAGDLTVFRIKDRELERAQSFQNFLEHENNNATKAERKGRSLSISFAPLIGPTSKKALRYCDKNVKAPFYVWYKLDQAAPYKRIIRTKNIDKSVGNSRAHMCKLAQNKFAPKSLVDAIE